MVPIVNQALGVCRCRFQDAIIARKVRALAQRHPQYAGRLLATLDPFDG
jgi:hypothetical protein